MTYLAQLRAQADRQNRATRDAAHTRMDRWQTKHAARLASMHPDVATEVRQFVLARFMAGVEGGLGEKDLHECLMRIASRIRVRRYGRCTDDEEAGRQLREVVEELGSVKHQAAA